MMFRVSALIALAAASRVEKHDHKLGLSCDDLHERFSSQLKTIRGQVDEMETESLSRIARAQLTMRLYGIGRTLRRSRDCTWLQDTDDSNVADARGLLETLFNTNPCHDDASAAMAAVSQDSSQDERAHAMQNAMEILSSDTCAATPTSGEEPDEEEYEGEGSELEEQVQDQIEGLMEDSSGSSFAETNEKYAIERFLRFLVVVAIYVFLVVICTWVVVWVGLFIIQYFTMLLGMLGVFVTGILWRDLILPPALLACGYDLFWRILNPEIHALPR
jgi:hypothetical protein